MSSRNPRNASSPATAIPAERVQPGTVSDPAAKSSHEVDVVAYGLDDDNRQPILAIGEAKRGETMGIGHRERLRHIEACWPAQGHHGADTAKLACYSAADFTDADFTDDLHAEADKDSQILLIAAADLYH